ncbi:MAG: type IV pilus biogenesis protein PilM [bacterium]
MRPLQQFLQIGARAVGIDIGARAIKVAELRRTTKGIELSRYGVAATPEAAVQNGMILDPPAAAEAIVAVLREAGIRARRVIASVSGQHVLARILRLPPIPENEVKQAVRWEAERHLPFPVEEAVLDTQVVGELSEDGRRQIEVLLAAAPEPLVLTYIETLEAAGLSADALEVSAVAMVRALTAPAPEGVVAMVNLGASSTEVAIVRDAVPQMTRTIPEGVEGSAATFETLGLQLRRSFDFYRAQDEAGHVDRIILCGGGARFPEIDRRLAQELDVPVTIGALPEALLISPTLDAATTSAAAPQLMIAVGLALRTLM